MSAERTFPTEGIVEFQNAVICANAGEAVEVRECDTIESWHDVEMVLGEDVPYCMVQRRNVFRFVIARTVYDGLNHWILLLNRTANVTPEEVHLWTRENLDPFADPEDASEPVIECDI